MVVIPVDRPRNPKKIESIERARELIDTYHSVILFTADNVGSNQMKKVRNLVQGKGIILMGKNSLFKKAFHSRLDRHPKFDRVMTQLSGNVGLLFTNEPLQEMREAIESIKEKAAARVGAPAQADVTIPKGPTSLPPDKTSFFQALNITTAIDKSVINLLNDVHLCKKGVKVGASEATLLQMLDIRPFAYSLITKFIYDNGMCYSPEILDIKSEDILKLFSDVCGDVASLSLEIGHTTTVSAPHVVQNAFKNLISLCMEAEIENEYTSQIKAAIETASTVVESAVEVKETQAKSQAAEPEPAKEESDEEFGFGLFD